MYNFEIWDQWHNLGVRLGNNDSIDIGGGNRKSLLEFPDLLWVFKLGVKLGIMLNSESSL